MQILAVALLDYLEPKYAQHFSIPISINKKIGDFSYSKSLLIVRYSKIPYNHFQMQEIHTLKANGLIFVMLFESRTSLFRYFSLENTVRILKLLFLISCDNKQNDMFF